MGGGCVAIEQMGLNRVLANIGSTPIGCHGIPVPPEGPPLGSFHRINRGPQGRIATLVPQLSGC